MTFWKSIWSVICIVCDLSSTSQMQIHKFDTLQCAVCPNWNRGSCNVYCQAAWSWKELSICITTWRVPRNSLKQRLKFLRWNRMKQEHSWSLTFLYILYTCALAQRQTDRNPPFPTVEFEITWPEIQLFLQMNTLLYIVVQSHYSFIIL